MLRLDNRGFHRRQATLMRSAALFPTSWDGPSLTLSVVVAILALTALLLGVVRVLLRVQREAREQRATEDLRRHSRGTHAGDV